MPALQPFHTFLAQNQTTVQHTLQNEFLIWIMFPYPPSTITTANYTKTMVHIELYRNTYDLTHLNLVKDSFL